MSGFSTEPVTKAGKAQHDDWHKTRKSSCPAAYGESCWVLDDIIAIEQEAQASEKGK